MKTRNVPIVGELLIVISMPDGTSMATGSGPNVQQLRIFANHDGGHHFFIKARYLEKVQLPCYRAGRLYDC